MVSAQCDFLIVEKHQRGPNEYGGRIGEREGCWTVPDRGAVGRPCRHSGPESREGRATNIPNRNQNVGKACFKRVVYIAELATLKAQRRKCRVN